MPRLLARTSASMTGLEVKVNIATSIERPAASMARTSRGSVPPLGEKTYFGNTCPLNCTDGVLSTGIGPGAGAVPGCPSTLLWLEPGESRTYETAIRVTRGREQIAALVDGIRAVQRQPEEDVPPLA